MVMQDNDKANFEALLRGIADVFSSTKTIVVNRPMLQVYFMSLTQYSYEQVEWAMGEHLKDPIDGKFFPKPANIIKHLKVGEISQEDKAMLAWSQVIREIRRTGSYGTLKLDDKQALAAVKALGSWQQLCNSTETEMTWKKKEFMNIYETYEKTPLDMLPNSMPGRFDLIDHKNEQSESFKRISDGIDDYRAKLKHKK
tara:strand:+ start:288 stop:881 length:594 start_codon:yes stop_codon:yes gene_type:complete